MSHMASSSALFLLLLLLPLSSFQSSLPSEQEISGHQAQVAPPLPPAPAPPHSRDLLQKRQTVNLNAKGPCKCALECTFFRLVGSQCVCEMVWLSPKDALSDKDNAKVGLFIAASVGTFALMAAVYCIYNKFYTKQQYLHAQLHDDSGELTGLREGRKPALSSRSHCLRGLTEGRDWARQDTRVLLFPHCRVALQQKKLSAIEGGGKKLISTRKNDKMRLKIKIETLLMSRQRKS